MPTARVLSTVLKVHGGKHYLAERILGLFPPRNEYTTYVEGYLGGGSVLLRHDPDGKSEIVCDANQHLTNFWRVLQTPAQFDKLTRMVSSTPFSEIEFRRAKDLLAKVSAETSRIEWAWAFFVVARQSMSGRNDSFAPASTNRLRRLMNEQVSSWWGAIDDLGPVANRVGRVFIHAGPAARVVKKYRNKSGVVIYLDPPYLQVDEDGRQIRESPEVYDHEMTLEQHVELLGLIAEADGAKILISGYPSKLYDRVLSGWHRTVFAIDNKASKKSTKDVKEEVVWSNYEPSKASHEDEARRSRLPKEAA